MGSNTVSLKMRLKELLQIAEIPLDQWKADSGILSADDALKLKQRVRMANALKTARFICLVLPRWMLRLPFQLFSFLWELENLHFAQKRKMHFGTGKHGARIPVSTWIAHGENITIGKNVELAPGSALLAGAKSGITIGDYTIISTNVTIVSFNHGYDDIVMPIRYQDYIEDSNSQVVIGSNVWISANVVILPGVFLGDGCIIGAGSVVTKSVPAGVIAVGCPARVIKTRTGYSIDVRSDGL